MQNQVEHLELGRLESVVGTGAEREEALLKKVLRGTRRAELIIIESRYRPTDKCKLLISYLKMNIYCLVICSKTKTIRVAFAFLSYFLLDYDLVGQAKIYLECQ